MCTWLSSSRAAVGQASCTPLEWLQLRSRSAAALQEALLLQLECRLGLRVGLESRGGRAADKRWRWDPTEATEA